MWFVIGFIICVVCSLINLPFVLEGGHVWNLLSMIFCAALAVFHLVMAAVDLLSR